MCAAVIMSLLPFFVLDDEEDDDVGFGVEFVFWRVNELPTGSACFLNRGRWRFRGDSPFYYLVVCCCCCLHLHCLRCIAAIVIWRVASLVMSGPQTMMSFRCVTAATVWCRCVDESMSEPPAGKYFVRLSRGAAPQPVLCSCRK